ncbi:MAG: hypothetical protein AAF549_06055 [Pseudomonadota bacterium]
MKFIFFLSFITLFCLPAEANTLVSFKPAKDRKEIQIIDYLQSSTSDNSTYLIAGYDLNNDIFKEYLVKNQNCLVREYCSYKIIAFKNRKPIIIGEFDAHKILISHEKNYGIHDLIIYNDENSDFLSKTAVWNPYQFRYVIKN